MGLWYKEKSLMIQASLIEQKSQKAHPKTSFNCPQLFVFECYNILIWNNSQMKKPHEYA